MENPFVAITFGQLIALVDALHRSTLSPTQIEIARSLRDGLALIAESEEAVVE